MEREIIAASFAWAAGRIGGVPVEATDEDGFTLASAAIGRLPWGRDDPGIGRVHVVGELPPGEPDDLGESIGVPGLTCVVRPGTWSGLCEALAEAASAPGPGSEALVILSLGPSTSDIPPAPHSGALALGLAHRPGIRFLGAAHIDAEAGEAESVLAAARRLEGDHATGSEAAGPIFLSFSPPNPDAAPLSAPTPNSSDSAGSRPGSRGAVPPSALLELRRALWTDLTGPVSLVMPSGPGTTVLVLDRQRPIARLGALSPPAGGVTFEAGSLPTRPSLDPPNVSEGAYVPKPTYRMARASRWRLAADQCTQCGHTTFPVRGRCASCGQVEGLTRRELPGRALEVEATTVVHRGAQPTEFDRQVESTGDYQVVIARVTPEVRVTLQVTDAPPGPMAVGDLVDVVLRRLIPMEGSWRYGLKAVPASVEESAPTDRSPASSVGTKPT